MTDDDLRPLLEEIAATAGDPPEHGLKRVALLRRRRKRHRRGAVAAAMALAVSTIAAAPWLAGFWDRDHDVTAADETEDRRTPPAELPDVLQMRCSSQGIEVPVASIRPQPDGMHIEIQNDLRTSTEVWVTSDEWDSGPISVDRGETNLRQPVPPGVLTVGCRIGGEEQQRRVDLVDAEGLYTAPELSCPDDDRAELTDLPVAEPTRSYVSAVGQALEDFLDDGDDTRPLDGYPNQRFGDPTADPTVRVVRDGENVAFVHLTSEASEEDGSGELGVWSGARLVSACVEFLDPDASPSESPDDDATDDDS
jgi:hypothetical protein